MFALLILGIWIHIGNYQMPVCLNCIFCVSQTVVENSIGNSFFFASHHQQFDISAIFHWNRIDLQRRFLRFSGVQDFFFCRGRNSKCLRVWYETLISAAGLSMKERMDGEWNSQWNMFGIKTKTAYFFLACHSYSHTIRTEYFKFDHSLFLVGTDCGGGGCAEWMHCKHTPRWANRCTNWDTKTKNDSTKFFDIRKEFYLWYHLSQSPPKAAHKATISHPYDKFTNKNELYGKNIMGDRC